MAFEYPQHRPAARTCATSLMSLALALGVGSAGACAPSTTSSALHSSSVAPSSVVPARNMSVGEPNPDPRVGLKSGLYDAGEASWNLAVLSQTRPTEQFVGITNSDLAFTGKYAIQGSYNGYQIWDISNPGAPRLETAYLCPASQSDVSVYRNLLFVSGEGLSGRIDCGTEGVKDTVSAARLRGLRIFDISDIAHPKNVGN
ncbi:MAG: LVIVD repeat-containing protein, partial [Gemmatimonadaceae bacterium]